MASHLSWTVWTGIPSLGVFVSDLRHFLDLPADVPGPARRMAEHLTLIVRAATSGESQQVVLGSLNHDAMLGEERRVEMTDVLGDDGRRSAGDGGRSVDAVVVIRTGHRVDEGVVRRGSDAPVGEGLADRGGDRYGLVGGAPLLPDDDTRPLVEEEVGPEDVVVEAALPGSEVPDQADTRTGTSTTWIWLPS